MSGHVLGRHDGHWAFTVGQRRGLRLAAPEPLYVLERRGAANEVVVGRREELVAASFVVRELLDRGLGDGSGPAGAAALPRRRCDGGRLGGWAPGAPACRWSSSAEAPAPGQSAVFYAEMWSWAAASWTGAPR